MREMTVIDSRPFQKATSLEDGFGRRFSYLRLSLTERCNFRCTYCLPNGFIPTKGLPPELSRDEIVRAVRAFAGLGLWKLRLTGGEPTVRTDFTEIAHELSAVPGIERLAMTTNGYRLERSASEWREAGVSAVNISIDTLDPAEFARITGTDQFDTVLRGVDAALHAGYDAVKINGVLMRDLESDVLGDVATYVKDRDVTWRFIELMRTNDNAVWRQSKATPGEGLRERLVREGWTPLPRAEGAGPSDDFAHPDYRGRVGLIAPYSHGFCESCNRLRLSSRGKLHLCLFGSEGLALRDLLQSDDQQDELVDRIRSAMPNKTRGHRLHDDDSGATPHLASIGG